MTGWDRVARLFGADVLAYLGTRTVGIVGLGSGGSFVAVSLAMSGVGRFILVEFDDYSPSNMNRQVACFADTLGRNKASVLSEEIKRRTGEETIVSDLTYDLRGGSPDAVDKMVAITFASMAIECIERNESGLMMAISEGRYATVPIPDPKLGPRKVDIATMYNTDRYRPSYMSKKGLPIFLTRA